MPSLLVVVASGPEHEGRALEGLRAALAIHHMHMLDEVRVLLTGPGVGCLDASAPESERLVGAVEALLAAGVPVAACTRSLNEHGLLETLDVLPDVRPVSAPTHIAAAVSDGTAVVTF